MSPALSIDGSLSEHDRMHLGLPRSALNGVCTAKCCDQMRPTHTYTHTLRTAALEAPKSLPGAPVTSPFTVVRQKLAQNSIHPLPLEFLVLGVSRCAVRLRRCSRRPCWCLVGRTLVRAAMRMQAPTQRGGPAPPSRPRAVAPSAHAPTPLKSAAKAASPARCIALGGVRFEQQPCALAARLPATASPATLLRCAALLCKPRACGVCLRSAAE